MNYEDEDFIMRIFRFSVSVRSVPDGAHVPEPAPPGGRDVTSGWSGNG